MAHRVNPIAWSSSFSILAVVAGGIGPTGCAPAPAVRPVPPFPFSPSPPPTVTPTPAPHLRPAPDPHPDTLQARRVPHARRHPVAKFPGLPFAPAHV